MLKLNGKELAQKINSEVATQALLWEQETALKPSLTVILVGEDPASLTYVKSKERTAQKIGFNSRTIQLEATVSEKELLELITKLNNSAETNAILVQLPLPPHIDEKRVIAQIDPLKDVDALHPLNMGKLVLGESPLVPCTPGGILTLFDFWKIETAGKAVTIIGRSNIVGKPLAALLVQKGRDATVTLCHSKTTDLVQHTLNADIIVVAIGVPQFLKGSMVKNGAVVVDVGINRVEDPFKERGYRLVGDVEWESVAPKCSAITPVPGGVGPLTIAMLMKNTLIAAREQHSRREFNG
ncbi:MAG: bifunctional 5,10-methylenetetrahydrofolate dehydrogenase/5,10-methenyltetrahydrofolate cyclohydrolase [Sphaerochaetaceae bacterium]